MPRKLYRYLVLPVFIVLLMQSRLQAQDTAKPISVTGLVVDEYARPVKGAKIILAGSSDTVRSDEAGAFNVNVTLPQDIIVMHPQFEVIRVPVRTWDDFTVKLRRSYLRQTLGLDTTVVTDRQQREVELLYETKPAHKILSSVATVYTNQISTTPSSLYLNALQGRLAGFNVNQVNGFYRAATSGLTDLDIFVGNIPKNNSGTGPSDNTEFSLQIRGHAGSLGQNPLVIIDGVQRELYSIDPQNIESVSVLKDALSTVLLGQNSSRGALLVTTKNPQRGAPRVSFTAESGQQSAIGLPKPLPAYQYAYLVNEALLNEGRTPAYTAADFEAYRNGTDPLGHPDVNWYDRILKKSTQMSRYNLSLNGGGDRARYIVSLSYLDQEGLFREDLSNPYNTNLALKRYLLNSKVDIDVNRDFNVGLQLFGRLQEGRQPGAGTGTILNTLMSTPNNAYPVTNTNGSFGGTNNYRTNLYSMVSNSGYLSDNSNDVMANLDLKYKFDKWIPGLYFKGRGNVSVQSSSLIDRSKQLPVFTTIVSNTGDTSYNRYGDIRNQSNQFTATSWARYTFAQLSLGYDRNMGDHHFQSLVLFDQKTTLLNYDIPGKTTNYAAKVSYDYQDKYLAEAAITYGGYNRFAPGSQYGVFYAGGVGWNVARENFIRDNVSWINELKLRASFGLTGNANVDNYGYYIYRPYFAAVAGTYPIGSAYPNGGGLSEGGTPNNQFLSNVNATWEKAHKLDIGMDLSLFNNHFQVTADYYYERYFDVLQQRGRSIALMGIQYPAENIGIHRYSGAEFTASYQDHVGNLNFFLTGNLSIQASRVLFMDEQFQPNEYNKMTGHPVGQRYGLQTDGFIANAQEAATYPSLTGYTLKVGDVKYQDLNGDGVIDNFDAAPIGKERPMIYYGLNAGLSYKGFAVSALIQGVHNREIYSADTYLDAGLAAQSGGFSQAYQQANGRWIPENSEGAIYPRLSPGTNFYNLAPNFNSTSLYLHDGNYFRLKNISVEYNVPYHWIQRLKLSGLKLFFTGQNLFTWNAYELRDPEVIVPAYPLQKVVNFGVNVRI